VTQMRIPESSYGPKDPDPLGVHVSLTHEALQTDCFKELINKIAWALGSTYRTPFSNTSTATRILARQMATSVVRTQGYPAKIARSLTTR